MEAVNNAARRAAASMFRNIDRVKANPPSSNPKFSEMLEKAYTACTEVSNFLTENPTYSPPVLSRSMAAEFEKGDTVTLKESQHEIFGGDPGVLTVKKVIEQPLSEGSEKVRRYLLCEKADGTSLSSVARDFLPAGTGESEAKPATKKSKK